ncbi:MAG: RHS repeat-associated core domain-containing protein, partial [Clostridia bacterium]|nr:RHS repeat-associated core domain-containing protein [Clostridia bacterium]
AHGDVTDIVSDDEVTNEYEYDAYGNQKNISASDTNPFRYCGEYYDEESGLIYLRNRYYDPEIERFITEDPIQDGMNWYAYCGNNPVMFVDNSGLDAVVITSDNAAGSSGIYAGHTSVIVQDKNGDWYYYYWGDEAAYLEKVSDNVMRSFASFNNWLSKEIDIGDLKNSTNNYTAATYIKGDFSKSYDYFYNLVKNADVGTKQKFGGPIVGYVEQSGNFDYSLFSKNCVTTSIEGLHKGTLSNGKSYGEVLPYRTIIPKLYKNAVRKVFGNSSFTEVK